MNSLLRSSRTTNKKCCGGKLVLGCFFNLGSATFAGCVLESTGKYGRVRGKSGKVSDGIFVLG